MSGDTLSFDIYFSFLFLYKVFNFNRIFYPFGYFRFVRYISHWGQFFEVDHFGHFGFKVLNGLHSMTSFPHQSCFLHSSNVAHLNYLLSWVFINIISLSIFLFFFKVPLFLFPSMARFFFLISFFNLFLNPLI
uniref:Uncharacterized protein n=1 Tax=Cacopsylla melanoneura TaxID=428564 RepID=A0A8D8ZHU1_9HEMI